MTDSKARIVWRDLADSVADELRIGKRQIIWELFEQLSTPDRRKFLGQYFTPKHVARFSLMGINSLPQTILDPMVGDGVFLEECAELFSTARLTGVDIDSLATEASRVRLDKLARIENEDVFSWAGEQIKKDAEFSFSVVAGNPAYVSYQNLDRVPEFSSQVVSRDASYRQFLNETLREISRRKGQQSVISVLREWSGLSDLSAYVILLSWLLIPVGGQIAFVTSSHWMERDYGRVLRRFLAKTGVVRGVVTHRRGEWFPQAQIPTSIFVYTKGASSARQENLGVPHVEVDAEATNDLPNFLKMIVGQEFWSWLDSVSTATRVSSLTLSFEAWGSTEYERAHAPLDTGMTFAIRDLVLPLCLKNMDLISLSGLGWEVHQGIRTGSNEAFYLERLVGSEDTFRARITKHGAVTTADIAIDRNLLAPSIRYLQRNSPFELGEESASWFLLNLDKVVLPEDLELIARYPASWKEKWNASTLRTAPPILARHLRGLATMPYEGKGGIRRVIPELSAVRTNVYIPPDRSTWEIPPRPRFWYQLRFQKRHFGELIVPRVSAGPLRTILVNQSGSLAIDANFSVLSRQSSALERGKLWAWFNSNTFRILCEENGSPLGGGALKVEATLISRLPIPRALVEDNEQELIENIDSPRKRHTDEEVLEIGFKIDATLFGEDVARDNLAKLRNLMMLRTRNNRERLSQL